MLKVLKDPSPWYAKGLPFECTGCGQCCTGAPGYVWLDEAEIQQIAQTLNLEINEFSKKYLRVIQGRFSLQELPHTYDCIFLKDKKCQIYSVRPLQCKTFPWWPNHLKTEKDWKQAARFCEGIQANASLVPLEEIEQQRSAQEKANKKYS